MKLAPVAALALLAAAAPAAAADNATLAKAFGAREAVIGMRLSPNGENLLYLKPLPGGHAAATILNIASSEAHPVARDADGNSHLDWCGWKTDKRLICRQTGIAYDGDVLLRNSRTAAIDADGNNGKELGFRPTDRSLGYVTSSGYVTNWLPDDPDNILMVIYQLPEATNDARKDWQGLAVQRVNVNTNARRMVEPPKLKPDSLDTDGQGRIRLMSTVEQKNSGRLTSRISHFYRLKEGGAWRPLAEGDLSAASTVSIEGFDDSGDWIYLLKPHNGRQALFRHSATGNDVEELVYARSDVDIDGLHRIGKYNRPVAASYSTTGRSLEFFDPALKKLDAALGKALPGSPLVSVVDESWDGTKKLIFAGSDTDPGRYYLYNATTRQLGGLLPVRPQLADLKLSQVKNITYPARDGTKIPAYLTLPPGKENAKGLPVLIMPHGGPSARDYWGFDPLAQFFAQLGYAVLQPNFRGSAGYGEAWFQQNGFRSWETAIGDINDGARWLVAQGIGDAGKMAIFGWSYGGYAALQANVAEPDLYKAVIAVAPVTDLQQLKSDAMKWTNRDLVFQFVGTGPHVTAGSPAQNAAKMKAPVLMFHGTKDVNVLLNQSKMMDAAFERAGKQHQLVVYQDLDHNLVDETARGDMLLKSADFLAANVKP